MIEALYIHVPFCVSRCSYCDFTTSACDDDARMNAYVDALSLQLRRASKAGLLGSVKTIYLGGGTPTHLGSKRLNSLAYLLSLSVNLESVDEFTCEANPESIDKRMIADLYALGVNRFSLGAQSFDDDELAAFGRAHDAKRIEEAIEAIRTRTNDISLDLICGGPGQTMESWRDSLLRLVESGVPHASVYPLMLEEGTELARRVGQGVLEVADEETQADMMLLARDLLADAGLGRYEVASYALSGFEAKHNIAYWTGREYLGLGSGASSMLSFESFSRACDAQVFDRACAGRDGSMALDEDMPPHRVRVTAETDDVEFSRSNGTPRIDVEFMDEHEAKVEDLMLGMRLVSGISLERVLDIPGARETFDELSDLGLVREDGGRFHVTDRGWLMGNVVFERIWDLAATSAHAR